MAESNVSPPVPTADLILVGPGEPVGFGEP